MQATDSRIRKHIVELESLDLDEALFNRIHDDLVQNSGRHMPAPVWLKAGGGGDEAASEFDAKSLITPWLGFGKTPVSPESLSWYYPFLKDIDTLGIVDTYFAGAEQLKPAAEDLLIADLGTIIDLNLIAPYLPAGEPQQPLRVIEVGGGYGRLAEAMFNVYDGQLKYVMIDAVPASLIFAYEYLTRARPDLRIGSFYRGDAYDLERFDIYICPIWHFETAGAGQFDLAINVQSMQEMAQHHVDYYLEWFDSVLKPGAVAYLCNRRDHVFRGAWHYPRHWECLLKICTPRSWIRDFPAEVYRKGERAYDGENALAEARYRRELGQANARQIADAAQAGRKIY
ncbi:putative sugar O-methyltransferase [Duganella aceris]|jgi:SAM-dependent methyltransferase|uniref:Sugar O-methyltransferase n=1 Tax=Duganella aceris TaxID=2703883 RepID=A0ABX0FEY1_9BURK|nr:putative sugar O-methyltransferase [Duganella aceris]NGZ83091.1 putative sugar O-methyltransferase [Duganella aceris]